MNIVAVTSCPTGIAHTYMAAEALEQAAEEAGHTIKVETQGAAGASALTAEEIAAADVVIFAVDVEVRDRGRFESRPIVQVGTNRAINDAAGLIGQAEERAAVAVSSGGYAGAGSAPPADGHQPGGAAGEEAVGFGTTLRQWLMTGVSYMIPFVAAGGS